MLNKGSKDKNYSTPSMKIQIQVYLGKVEFYKKQIELLENLQKISGPSCAKTQARLQRMPGGRLLALASRMGQSRSLAVERPAVTPALEHCVRARLPALVAAASD